MYRVGGSYGPKVSRTRSTPAWREGEGEGEGDRLTRFTRRREAVGRSNLREALEREPWSDGGVIDDDRCPRIIGK